MKDLANDEEGRSAILDQILKPVTQTTPHPPSILGRSASFNQRENHTQTEIIRR